MSAPSILVVAGEISGDLHAAALVRAVRRRRPDIAWFGIGGDALQAAGVELHFHVRDMAVLGLSEVLRRLGFFRRAFARMLALARERRPAAVLLVDYPGFNLRLAARAHAMGIRVLYYIGPQVWAWNRGRIPRMARTVDRLMAIFPFEVDVFRGSGLRVDYVGHPLAARAAAARAAPPEPLPWPGSPRIALLPGSRRQEIDRILPALWAAAARLERLHPGAGFLVAAPTDDVAGWVRARLARLRGGPARSAVLAGRTLEVLRQARAAWVASGTATLEAALMGCPTVVVYRTAWATYAVGRRLIRVPHLGMVNLVAGAPVCPECIQGGATPAALAAALAPLLHDGPARASMIRGLSRVALALGAEDPATRAADIVIEELNRAPAP